MTMMPLWLPLLAQAAVPAPPPADAAPTEIVVTARSTAKLQRDLDACLARHCPPREDLLRSRALAQAQFLGGDYRHSEETLAEADHRNGRFAVEMPVEIGTLRQERARLSQLNGKPDAERMGAFGSIDALKAGLDRDDGHVLLARIAIGDMMARQGRLFAGLDVYSQVEREAHQTNQPLIAALALFNKATLLAVIANVEGGYKEKAEKAIRELEALPGPELAALRNGARLIMLQLMQPKAAAKAAPRIIAGLEPVSSDQPVLAWGPSIDPAVLFSSVSGSAETRWADIAFTILPDGTVRDAHAVRTSPKMDPRWLARDIDTVAARRYVPMPAADRPEGWSRLERHSFVNDMEVGNAIHDGVLNNVMLSRPTRIRERSSITHLVVHDLTPKDAAIPKKEAS